MGCSFKLLKAPFKLLPYIKFIYSKKAKKLLSYVVSFKIKVKISQNFVALSEYMNFKSQIPWENFFRSLVQFLWKNWNTSFSQTKFNILRIIFSTKISTQNQGAS